MAEYARMAPDFEFVRTVSFDSLSSQKQPTIERQLSAVEERIKQVVEDRPEETPTLATLTWPPRRDEYFSNVLAGLISGLKIVLGLVTFANIVWNSVESPSVNGLFTTGINLNMMAACVGLLSSAILSDMNALVCPQDVPAIVLGQLAPDIVAAVENEQMAGPTLLAAGWISTLLTGIFVLLLGRLKAGSILRKLPSSVVGGFIASLGATGIRSSISMLSGAPFHILWPSDFTTFHDWKTWAHLALALYSLISIRYLGNWVKPHIKSKSMQGMASPLCLLSPILVFYLGLACRGWLAEDFAWLQEVGWVYPPSKSGPFYDSWGTSYRFDLVDWNALMKPAMASELLVLAGLTSLSAVLAIIGTGPVVPCATNRGGLGGKLDLDKELTILGGGQLVVGALTGFPGFQQVALSANMYIFGGTHRLAEFVTTGFVVLVMVSGLNVATVVPKFFLGAVFLNLGISFCKTHLVDNWGLMDPSSYCAMLTIVFVGLWQGLTMAVAVGVVIETVLTVRQASATNPVYQCGSSDGGFLSSRIRNDEAAARLRWSMTPLSVQGCLEVVRLHGPLFFGNSPTLEDEVTSLIRALTPKLSHFIVDMTGVTQVDDSGARALASILKFARDAKVRYFAVAGAGLHVRSQFEKHLIEPVRISDTLEEVLEIYEDDLLEVGNNGRQCPTPPRLCSAKWEILKKTCSREVHLKDGELLFDFGQHSDGVWLLVHGNLTMETKRAGMSSQTVNEVSAKYTAPMVVGNSAHFIGSKRHAFRVRGRGESGATVLLLTQADLEKLETENPSTYIAFLKDFAGYWMAVEANHLRWRCAVNQF